MSVSQQVNERLAALTAAGTSVWLDQIRRSLIEGGELQRLIDEDSLRGVTSNPSIFEKAILGSHDYDDELAQLAGEGKRRRRRSTRRSRSRTCSSAATSCARSTTRPTATTATCRSRSTPDLAHDTDATLAAGARLLAARRPPERDDQDPGHGRGRARRSRRRSTRASTSTSRCCSRSTRYAKVAEAFIRGLERRARGGRAARRALRRVASSSRASTPRSTSGSRRSAAPSSQGIAGRRQRARRLRRFKEIFRGERFAELREAGAPVQRPLWASTGVKNPDYPDTMYVDELVGPGHGQHDADGDAARRRRPRRGRPAPRPTIDPSGRPAARWPSAGIDLDDVTDEAARRRRRRCSWTRWTS